VYKDLFDQAGSLTEIAPGSDEEDMRSALRDFAPSPDSKKTEEEPSGEGDRTTGGGGGGTRRVEVVLTAGNITMNSDGTASMTGSGYTNLPVG